MKPETGREKRQHPRAGLNFVVRFRELGAEEARKVLAMRGLVDPPLPSMDIKRGFSGIWTLAATSLSEGGLGAAGDLELRGDFPLGKGHIVLAEMDLEDGEAPLLAAAQVMWTRPCPGTQHLYMNGMMFLSVSEAGQARIRKSVEGSPYPG